MNKKSCAHRDGTCAQHRGMFDAFPGTDAETFIQWKGTDVCVDIYCRCGEQFHFDGMFMYAIRCPHCGTVYEVGTQVQLRRVSDLAEIPHHRDNVKEGE